MFLSKYPLEPSSRCLVHLLSPERRLLLYDEILQHFLIYWNNFTKPLRAKHVRRQLSHSCALLHECSILPVNVVLLCRNSSCPGYWDHLAGSTKACYSDFSVVDHWVEFSPVYESPELREPASTKWVKYQFWVNYPLKRSCCQKPPLDEGTLPLPLNGAPAVLACLCCH